MKWQQNILYHEMWFGKWSELLERVNKNVVEVAKVFGEFQPMSWLLWQHCYDTNF